MPSRPPAAADFYRGDVRSQVADFLEGFTPPPLPSPVRAAVVPHAGWFFSGRVAARVFETIRQANPALEVLVLLGAVHRWRVRGASVDPSGAWQTPLGDLPVDASLAARLLSALPDLLRADPAAHDVEHAIEVQCPLIRALFPDARVVPVAVPPAESAATLGEQLGALLADEPAGRVAVVASTDLTHYGERYGFSPAGAGPEARAWMRENDQRLIDMAAALRADTIVDETRARSNACGAGALAAAVAAARAQGVTAGRVIEYTTSYDVLPEPVFRMAVGYVGMVF